MARQLLFICSQNRWRSLTAERLFDDHAYYEARSAGTKPGARVRVTAGHLGWADVIFVMERRHKGHLQAKFASSWLENLLFACAFLKIINFKTRCFRICCGNGCSLSCRNFKKLSGQSFMRHYLKFIDG